MLSRRQSLLRSALLAAAAGVSIDDLAPRLAGAGGVVAGLTWLVLGAFGTALLCAWTSLARCAPVPA